MKKKEKGEYTLSTDRKKISISETLRKRGITEEKILELESLGLLKKYGINKTSESRYIQFLWYKDNEPQKA
jgi:hypothetical protein